MERHYTYCKCGRLGSFEIRKGQSYCVPSCPCGSPSIREITKEESLLLEDMPFNSSRVEWYNNQRQKEWWEV